MTKSINFLQKRPQTIVHLLKLYINTHPLQCKLVKLLEKRQTRGDYFLQSSEYILSNCSDNHQRHLKPRGRNFDDLYNMLKGGMCVRFLDQR